MANYPQNVTIKTAVNARTNIPFNHKHVTTSDFGITHVTGLLPVVPTDVVDIDLRTFARMMPMLSPTMGDCSVVHRAFFIPHDFVSADFKSFITNQSLALNSVNAVPSIPSFSQQYLIDMFIGLRGFGENSIPAPITSQMNKWLTSAIESNSFSQGFIPIFDLVDVWVTNTRNGGEPATPPEAFDFGPNLFSRTDSTSVDYAIFYRFKPLGKIVYNLLLQLGYSLPFGQYFTTPRYDTSGTGTWYAFHGFVEGAVWRPLEFSLLPILSLLKVYIDYYADPRYNYNDFTQWFRLLNTEGWNQVHSQDKVNLIHDFLVFCAYMWYPNDLFTSAWLSQESAAPFNLMRNIQINDNNSFVSGGGRGNITPAGTQVENTYAGVNVSTSQSGANLVRISQHLLDLLKSVSDFFKRNNMAGQRPIDQLLAKFGIHQPELLAGRSQYLGSFYAPVQISDVMATAAGSDNDGSTSVLGDYAGKGFVPSQDSFRIHYENKYFYGYIMIVSHIIPQVCYYEGIKPHTLQLDQFDFFTPEMEDTGTVPLPNAVVYDNAVVKGSKLRNDGIFGWVPRDYMYKFPIDSLTGDFRLKRYYESLRPFHMFRELTDFYEPNANDIVNNQNFRIFDDKARAVYDKIFVSQSVDEDHFVIKNEFDININRPMQGIGRSLVGDLRGGSKEVSIRPNGKYF